MLEYMQGKALIRSTKWWINTEYALVNQTPERHPYMDKVTIIEAARMVDLHPNTVRNWRKSGKLKTAEKVLDNNVETWVVDPQEVNQLANQARSTNGVNNRSYTVDVPDGQPSPEPVPQPPPAAITSVQEQTIAFMRESVVRPLVEANERLVSENGSLREEVGTLKERLRALEAAQTVPQPAPAPQQVQPVTIEQPQQIAVEPVKKGFWARVLGL